MFDLSAGPPARKKPPKITVYQNPPDGTSRQTFRGVVAAAHMAFQLHNQDYKNREGGRKTLPDVKKIAELSQHTERTVSKVIATEEFRMAMREKGIYWTARDGLTPEQIYCIGIMTNPSDRRDMAGKLKAAGVSYHVYRGWLKMPAFRTAVQQIGEDMLNDHIQDVNTSLLNKAVGGDVRAIELYHQITGRFDPRKQQAQDLHMLVQMLLETIFKYVTDTKVLSKITEDFDRAMAGEHIKPDLVLEPIVEEVEYAEVVEDSAPVEKQNEDIPAGFFDFFEENK